MHFFEQLNHADSQLFLFLNGKHTAFFDVFMYWMSDKLVWIPFYIVLLFFVVKYYKKKTIYILFLVALLITLSDQISTNVIKNYLVQRLRPCHNPELIDRIHLVTGSCGGQFGFVSSHASNTFALAIFLGFLLKKRVKYLHIIILGWAVIVSYSRIYNGVHYPGDVIGGALLGFLLGCSFCKTYIYIDNKLSW